MRLESSVEPLRNKFLVIKYMSVIPRLDTQEEGELGLKTFYKKAWFSKNNCINEYSPNNNAKYKQVFNKVNCNKLKEIREEKAQTQEFIVEIRLIAYVPL